MCLYYIFLTVLQIYCSHMFGNNIKAGMPIFEETLVQVFTFASFFPLETGALADASFLALHPDPPNNSPRPLGPVQ